MPLPPGFQLEGNTQQAQAVNLPPGFQLEKSPIDAVAHNTEWTATEMPLHKQILAGIGKTMSDVGSGVAQRFGFGPSKQEVEANRERDAQLMATPGGFGGSILGGAALVAPTAALPFANTVAGQAVIGGLYGGSQPTGTSESATKNALIGALAGGATKYGLDKLGNAVSGIASKSAADVAPGNARTEQLSKVLNEGRDMGLTVPPSQANPSTVNRVLESIGGKAATQQQASAANQDIIYAAGQRHAGLQPNQAITEETLANARSVAAEPYRAVAQTSPDAATALEMWRNANNEAKLYGIENARSGTVASYKAMKNARAEADMALDEIERLAGSSAKDALKSARVQIAKIHTVDDAMRGSSFNAQALANALDKNVPLSGELRTIGQFAQDFPKAVAPPQQGGSVGVNQLMPWLGGAGGAIGGAALGGGAGAGIGSVLGTAATQAAPPLARSLILSQPYQRMLANPQTHASALKLIDALLSNPATKTMLPTGAALTAAGMQQ